MQHLISGAPMKLEISTVNIQLCFVLFFQSKQITTNYLLTGGPGGPGGVWAFGLTSLG